MIGVAVVGVGSMGKNHTRVYREMENVQLLAVVDENPQVADAVGRLYHVPAYHNFREMVENEHPQAVSVTVPTQRHFDVGLALLEAGCHVLVEKPISTTMEEAQTLVETSERLKRVLMVGHIERYNPAVIALKQRLDAGALGRVFQIYARRLGPYPNRIQDVGCVMDLAPHDLDIMRYLTGSEVMRVYAESKSESGRNHEELFTGILRFADGTVGLLEINWLTPTKIRELYVTGERGMFRVNYLTQDLIFYENAEVNNSNFPALNLFRGVSEGAMTKFALSKKEPLRAELEAFISRVEGTNQHYVNGCDAMIALALSKILIESARTNQVKEVQPL
jgi:predicted dehydrogenase